MTPLLLVEDADDFESHSLLRLELVECPLLINFFKIFFVQNIN
jgi:hypothetical protein